METQFMQTMLSRRSIRQYRDDPIPEELLRAVLDAGINAPSAHDSRPWRFAVLVSAESRHRLTAALQSRFRADMQVGGFAPDEIEARLARSRQRFGGAPVLVVAFAELVRRDNPLATGPKTEQLMAAQSVALAAGQMALAAHGLGLGCCWFAAPLFCPQEVCDACGFDGARWQPQCLLALGYPDEAPKPKQSPHIEDVCRLL